MNHIKTKFRFAILSQLMVLLLLSCNQSRNNTDKIGAPSNELKLINAKELSVVDTLYKVSDMALIQQDETYYALVADVSVTPPIHLINISEDSYIAGLSREGKGPGEFVLPTSISTFEDSFVVYDGRAFQLTYIPFSVFQQPKDRAFNNFQVKMINTSGLAFNILPTSQNEFISVGPIQSNKNVRFTRINTNDDTNSFFGENESIPNVAPDLFQLINREYGSSSMHKKRFVTGKYYQDRLDIFEFDGTTVTTYKGADYQEFAITSAGGAQTMDTDKTKMAYLDFATNGRFIYALYSGQSYDSPNHSKTVRVFNWDGDFITTLELIKPASNISVDEENTMLLAGSFISSEPSLTSYEIKIDE